jgi:hypothetical protein
LRVTPESRLLSSKPQQGASAALDERFGLTATAAGEAAAKLKSRQGVRLPNASDSHILRELALALRQAPKKRIYISKISGMKGSN